MLFGHVSGPGARTVWFLLLLGGLLIWAGRSDAARLDEGAPAVAAPPPQLSRIDSGDVEARLAISGQMVVLRLRGGDLEALAARIDGAAEREIAIRLDGEEVLAVELRELRLESDPLEGRARLADPDITLGPPPVIAAAVSTRAARPHDSEEAEDAAPTPGPELLTRPLRAEVAALAIPEPATAALLAGGLIGLGLAGGRARA